MTVNSFLLSLTSPPRICVSARESFADCEDLSFDGISLVHGYPDWLGFPDILFDSNTRAFSGLAFHIVEEQLKMAYRMCANLDERVLRFRNEKYALTTEMYSGGDAVVWLEITWAKMKNAAYVPAQLAEVHFYFDTGYEESGDDPCVIAFELFQIKDILHSYDLNLPDLSAFSQLALQ